MNFLGQKVNVNIILSDIVILYHSVCINLHFYKHFRMLVTRLNPKVVLNNCERYFLKKFICLKSERDLP